MEWNGAKGIEYEKPAEKKKKRRMGCKITPKAGTWPQGESRPSGEREKRVNGYNQDPYTNGECCVNLKASKAQEIRTAIQKRVVIAPQVWGEKGVGWA